MRDTSVDSESRRICPSPAQRHAFYVGTTPNAHKSTITAITLSAIAITVLVFMPQPFKESRITRSADSVAPLTIRQCSQSNTSLGITYARPCVTVSDTSALLLS